MHSIYTTPAISNIEHKLLRAGCHSRQTILLKQDKIMLSVVNTRKKISPFQKNESSHLIMCGCIINGSTSRLTSTDHYDCFALCVDTTVGNVKERKKLFCFMPGTTLHQVVADTLYFAETAKLTLAFDVIFKTREYEQYIALSSAIVDVQDLCSKTADISSGFGRWFDLNTVDKDDRFAIYQSYHYLKSLGCIHHHPNSCDLFQLKINGSLPV
jgi:hypothetical protein